MIVKVTMYGCVCDNCGTDWQDEHNGYTAFADENAMHNILGDDTDWYTDTSGKKVKHYCPKCFGGFDDDDNLIINPKE